MLPPEARVARTADPARRALLHAAWVTPTVVVAAAVPAHAASVPATPPTVTVVVTSIRGFDGTLRVTHTIRNTGQTATTAISLVTTIAPAAGIGTIGTTVVVESAAPWSASTGGTTTARTVTLVKSDGRIAPGGEVVLSFRIDVTRPTGAPITGTLTTAPSVTPGQAVGSSAAISDVPAP